MNLGDGTDLRSTLTRPGENAVKRWFLLTGGRLTVTFALLAGVFAFLLAMALVKPVGMEDLLDETNAAKTLFSGLLSGAILLVSIVVSINSITLSEEITDIEDQQDRIDASVQFHRRIEEFIEVDITPARPAEFLNAVLYAISQQTQAITRLASENGDDAFNDDVEQLADQVARDVRQARQTLGDAQLGTFMVLLAGLNYDYSGQLHSARAIKRKHSDTMDEKEAEAVDELVKTLKHVGTGREYFKSLYYKRELARLSSRLLFVSLPVIVFTSYVILALDANLLPSVPALGISARLVPMALLYTVAIAPYVVLTAYIMRTATITLRTLAAGPFILQKGSDIDAFEWEGPEEKREWTLTNRVEGD